MKYLILIAVLILSACDDTHNHYGDHYDVSTDGLYSGRIVTLEGDCINYNFELFVINDEFVVATDSFITIEGYVANGSFVLRMQHEELDPISRGAKGDLFAGEMVGTWGLSSRGNPNGQCNGTIEMSIQL
jgi:hypothetical protein